MPTITARQELSQPTSAVASATSAPLIIPPATTATSPTPLDASAPPTTENAETKQETKEQLLSPRFAQLARKEKAIRLEQQKIQKEREELKAKLAEYETSYIPKAKLSELAKTNPLQALEQMGLTPDEFTQALLQSNPQEAQIQRLMARIDQLESANQKTMTTIEDQQKKAYDQALRQIRTDCEQIVREDTRFETIREADERGWGATEGAVSLIEEVFKEGWPEKKIPAGTVISNDQALGFIQEWVQTKAYEMAQLKGVKEKFIPVAAPTEAPKQPVTTVAPARTLSQNMTASKTTRLTEKERRERAILALTGQL